MTSSLKNTWEYLLTQPHRRPLKYVDKNADLKGTIIKLTHARYLIGGKNTIDGKSEEIGLKGLGGSVNCGSIRTKELSTLDDLKAFQTYHDRNHPLMYLGEHHDSSDNLKYGLYYDCNEKRALCYWIPSTAIFMKNLSFSPVTFGGFDPVSTLQTHVKDHLKIWATWVAKSLKSRAAKDGGPVADDKIIEIISIHVSCVIQAAILQSAENRSTYLSLNTTSQEHVWMNHVGKLFDQEKINIDLNKIIDDAIAKLTQFNEEGKESTNKTKVLPNHTTDAGVQFQEHLKPEQLRFTIQPTSAISPLLQLEENDGKRRFDVSLSHVINVQKVEISLDVFVGWTDKKKVTALLDPIIKECKWLEERFAKFNILNNDIPFNDCWMYSVFYPFEQHLTLPEGKQPHVMNSFQFVRDLVATTLKQAKRFFFRTYANSKTWDQEVGGIYESDMDEKSPSGKLFHVGQYNASMLEFFSMARMKFLNPDIALEHLESTADNIPEIIEIVTTEIDKFQLVKWKEFAKTDEEMTSHGMKSWQPWMSMVHEFNIGACFSTEGIVFDPLEELKNDISLCGNPDYVADLLQSKFKGSSNSFFSSLRNVVLTIDKDMDTKGMIGSDQESSSTTQGDAIYFRRCMQTVGLLFALHGLAESSDSKIDPLEKMPARAEEHETTFYEKDNQYYERLHQAEKDLILPDLDDKKGESWADLNKATDLTNLLANLKLKCEQFEAKSQPGPNKNMIVVAKQRLDEKNLTGKNGRTISHKGGDTMQDEDEEEEDEYDSEEDDMVIVKGNTLEKLLVTPSSPSLVEGKTKGKGGHTSSASKTQSSSIPSESVASSLSSESIMYSFPSQDKKWKQLIDNWIIVPHSSEWTSKLRDHLEFKLTVRPFAREYLRTCIEKNLSEKQKNTIIQWYPKKTNQYAAEKLAVGKSVKLDGKDHHQCYLFAESLLVFETSSIVTKGAPLHCRFLWDITEVKTSGVDPPHVMAAIPNMVKTDEFKGYYNQFLQHDELRAMLVPMTASTSSSSKNEFDFVAFCTLLKQLYEQQKQKTQEEIKATVGETIRSRCFALACVVWVLCIGKLTNLAPAPELPAPTKGRGKTKVSSSKQPKLGPKTLKVSFF